MHCCYVSINIGGGIKKQQQFKGESMPKYRLKSSVSNKILGFLH